MNISKFYCLFSSPKLLANLLNICLVSSQNITDKLATKMGCYMLEV